MYTVVQNLTQFRLPTSISNGKSRGGSATFIGGKEIFLVLSYFELFNSVDQNNGEEKGITILVQKKFSVLISPFTSPLYKQIRSSL